MLTIIIVTFVLLICFFVGLYILEIRSEPYNFALEFIDNNKTVWENVGPQKTRRLSFFGYSVRYSGPSGRAEYKIKVKGEKGEGDVYLELEKSVGRWKAIQGNLVLGNGETVPLVNQNEGD